MMIDRRKKKVAEDLFEGDYDNRDVLYWNDTKDYFDEIGITDAYQDTVGYDNDWN